MILSTIKHLQAHMPHLSIRAVLIAIVFAGSMNSSLQAQLTLSNGEHIVEITGMVSTYYNHRFLKSDNDNRNKDRFRLRDAIFKLEGRHKDLYSYEIQIDFANLSSTGEIDPENPGLMDAYFTYKGLSWFDMTIGYGKHFYSRSSMVPFIYTPYWQRAELVRGDVFSRRDVGFSISKGMWRQRINVYAGVYTGLGEVSLRGDNDASGRPEYIARVDFAYPSRYRYRDIDTRHTPIPMFAIGFNGRYANKVLPEGRGFPAFSTGEFGMKVVNGERLVYGMDASFQYMGFSGQFEIHQLRGVPINANDALLQGLSMEESGGFFLSGGYIVQMNYFSKKMKTIVSLRFEELDLSDLVPGNAQRMGGALAYQLKGFDSMIKLQYFQILREESIDPKRWTHQIRLGWQLLFR